MTIRPKYSAACLTMALLATCALTPLANSATPQKSTAAATKSESKLGTGLLKEIEGLPPISETYVREGAKVIEKKSSTGEDRYYVPSDRVFMGNEASFTPRAEVTLKALGQFLQKEGDHPVTIEGHTDSTIGGIDYCQRVSQGRAQAIADWLINHKYISPVVFVHGYGKARPRSADKYSDGSYNPYALAANNRIEVSVDLFRSSAQAKKQKDQEEAEQAELRKPKDEW